MTNNKLDARDYDDIAAFRNAGNKLLDLYNAENPTREINLAKTKLEESIMWAVKSITG